MDSEKEGEISSLSSRFSKFFNLFENVPANTRAAIFTHAFPDPDALGSMMGLAFLLEKKYGIESDLIYDGKISHPQNTSMVNLLDVPLKPIESFEPVEGTMNFLVDTIPSHAGVGHHKICFDAVIDHHKEAPNGGFKGYYLNIKAGSCCATVYQLIEDSGLEFQDGNDHDSKVATALMVGITTDTENLVSDDTTEYEFKAWSKLFEFRHPLALKQIINFQRPKTWTDLKAEGIKRAIVNDGIVVVGLGRIPGKHRDIVADMATEAVTWEDVRTSIAFALIDGNRIEGSVRTTNASISVLDLCKELSNSKNGSGGAKFGKGAYRYDLGGASLEEDEEEDIKQEMWNIFNKRETARIFRILGKS